MSDRDTTVACTYAAVLGPLALAVVLIRGAALGSSAAGTFAGAWLALMVFAALGYVLGRLADRTVEESVRQRIEGELAARSEGKAG